MLDTSKALGWILDTGPRAGLGWGLGRGCRLEMGLELHTFTGHREPGSSSPREFPLAEQFWMVLHDRDPGIMCKAILLVRF